MYMGGMYDCDDFTEFLPQVQPGNVGSMVRLECRVATAGRKNLITWDRGGRQVSGQEPGITLTFTEVSMDIMLRLTSFDIFHLFLRIK